MTQRERQILQWIEQDPMISQEALAEKAGITRSSVAVHISNLIKKGYIIGKGYVLRTGTYAAVVGGVNMDIGGQSDGPLVPGDSNPGRVRISLGGVGRNIAHNMALLGLDVRFLTAFGDDLYAQRIAASCGELGIDISQALRVPGGSTSTYLYLNGPDGDMALAVSEDDAPVPGLSPDAVEGGAVNCSRRQFAYRISPVFGGSRRGASVCGPGVHGQGGKAAANSGKDSYPETQPDGGGASVRCGHHK